MSFKVSFFSLSLLLSFGNVPFLSSMPTIESKLEEAVVALTHLSNLFINLSADQKSVIERFEADGQSKIVIECCNTDCNHKINFADMTAMVVGKRVQDLIHKAISYDAVKAELDDLVAIMASGDSERLKKNMLCTVRQQWFACTQCKGKAWHIKVPIGDLSREVGVSHRILDELTKVQENIGKVFALFKVCFVDHRDAHKAFDKKLREKQISLVCANADCLNNAEYFNLSSIVATVAGIAIRELGEGIGSYNNRKLIIDEATKLMKEGSVSSIQAFMERMKACPWFVCSRCDRNAWTLQLPK